MGWEGGGGARKVLENEKVVLEKKLGKCGVQNQRIGVWAWCLIILFVVLKTPFCGVKNR